MKKFLTLMVVALCCCHAFAQSESTDSTKVKKSSYGFYKNFSHWSIAVSGGFDFLMSERDQVAGTGIKNYSDNFLGEFNCEVQYGINPIWSVALEYAYAPFNKKSIFEKGNFGIYPEKHGQGHQVLALVDINLLNLYSRYRKHTEWGWYAGAGLGMFAYNTSKEYILNGTEKWTIIPMFSFESHIDYSPINSLSIFIKAALGTYLRDDVNVCADAALNDWNLYGGVGLRWNINASKKPHVRVSDMDHYESPDGKGNGFGHGTGNDNCNDTATQNKVKQLEKQLKDLQDQMSQMSQMNNNNCCDQVEEIKKHADRNTEEINRLRFRLDSVNRHTNINTEISNNSVYFEHNSWEIDDKYNSVIEKVARIMKSYPYLQLDITAFCSKVGNVEKNRIVGENRIEAVKAVLIEVYGIDPRRIHSNYNGQVFEGLQSENRRCDLYLH